MAHAGSPSPEQESSTKSTQESSIFSKLLSVFWSSSKRPVEKQHSRYREGLLAECLSPRAAEIMDAVQAHAPEEMNTGLELYRHILPEVMDKMLSYKLASGDHPRPDLINDQEVYNAHVFAVNEVKRQLKGMIRKEHVAAAAESRKVDQALIDELEQQYGEMCAPSGPAMFKLTQDLYHMFKLVMPCGYWDGLMSSAAHTFNDVASREASRQRLTIVRVVSCIGIDFHADQTQAEVMLEQTVDTWVCELVRTRTPSITQLNEMREQRRVELEAQPTTEKAHWNLVRAHVIREYCKNPS